MKRCVNCHSTYDDDVRFCDLDGTPLLSVAVSAPSPVAQRRWAALKTGGAVAAAIGLLAVVCLGAFFVMSRHPAGPARFEEGGRDVTAGIDQGAFPPAGATPSPTPAAPSDWLRALLGPPATPSPTPPPPPEMTPAPTASPAPVSPGKVAGRVEGRRIKSITRPPVVERTPSPTPQPTARPQESPEAKPTATPALRSGARVGAGGEV